MDVASSWMFSPMTAAQCCARVLWFNHALLETEPLHPFVVSAAAGKAPPAASCVCGQKTQLRRQSASVCAARARELCGACAAGSVEACASSDAMNFPRRKQPPCSHAPSMMLRSRGQVLFAPQMSRCSCAATSRAVLMRRGTPTLSCRRAVFSTGVVRSRRVSTVDRSFLWHEEQRDLRACLRLVSTPGSAGVSAAKWCRCCLLLAGSEPFWASIAQLTCVLVRVHICVEYVAPGIGSSVR